MAFFFSFCQRCLRFHVLCVCVRVCRGILPFAFFSSSVLLLLLFQQPSLAPNPMAPL